MRLHVSVARVTLFGGQAVRAEAGVKGFRRLSFEIDD
jgi:hypothetical protein